MKAREFVRKHVIPAGGVLERKHGDHHVFRFPNGSTFDVPMGGRQSEAAHFLLPKLRRLLRASGAAAAVVLAVVLSLGCGGAQFTTADSPVPDGGGQEDAARDDAPAVSVAQDSPATDTGSHVVSPEAAADAAPEVGHDGSSGSSGGSSSSGPSSSSSSGGASSSGSSGSSSSSGSSGSSSGSSGSSSGSSSSSSSSSSGGSSSGSSGGVVDAGPCDGGPVYTHHVGVSGVTWQDCVPTGTDSATQAEAACTALKAYELATNGISCTCTAPQYACEAVSNPTAPTSVTFYNSAAGCPQIVWTFGQSAAPGHVVSGGACPTTTDATWN